MNSSKNCGVDGCTATAAVLYSGHPVCMGHLEMHCKGQIDLKKVFKIDEVAEVCAST